MAFNEIVALATAAKHAVLCRIHCQKNVKRVQARKDTKKKKDTSVLLPKILFTMHNEPKRSRKTH